MRKNNRFLDKTESVDQQTHCLYWKPEGKHEFVSAFNPYENDSFFQGWVSILFPCMTLESCQQRLGAYNHESFR